MRISATRNRTAETNSTHAGVEGCCTKAYSASSTGPRVVKALQRTLSFQRLNIYSHRPKKTQTKPMIQRIGVAMGITLRRQPHPKRWQRLHRAE